MLVELSNISKNYAHTSVLNSFSMQIKKNEIVCVVGPSGCGKSTILNLISGLESPDKGAILNEYNRLGYVFQEDRLLPWKTVKENIAIVKDSVDERHIKELINVMGLQGFEDSYPNELSGGMKQRCSIARAFYYGSDLLLMDEPFKSLDYDLRLNMVSYLLKVWQKSKTAIVFVTHNIDEALLLGDRILVLTERPTKVKENIEIKIKHNNRDLTSPVLNDIRNKVIKNITKTQKRGA